MWFNPRPTLACGNGLFDIKINSLKSKTMVMGGGWGRFLVKSTREEPINFDYETRILDLNIYCLAVLSF